MRYSHQIPLRINLKRADAAVLVCFDKCHISVGLKALQGILRSDH
jgi:hypothetical protein